MNLDGYLLPNDPESTSYDDSKDVKRFSVGRIEEVGWADPKAAHLKIVGRANTDDERILSVPMLDAVVLAGCDENRQRPYRVHDNHPGNDSFSQVPSGIVDERSYADPFGEAIFVICADGESGLMLRVCAAQKAGDVMAM